VTAETGSVTGTSFVDLPARQRRRLVLAGVLRTLVTVAVLVALYFALPLDHGTDAATVAALVIGLLVVVAIVYVQIRSIIKSQHADIRAVESLAFTVSIYILLFATTYYLIGRSMPPVFTEPLTRTDSLYFSVTVFTTVGFGDITAKSEGARLLVTSQMVLDVVLVGLAVRLVVQAVRRSQQHKA